MIHMQLRWFKRDFGDATSKWRAEFSEADWSLDLYYTEATLNLGRPVPPALLAMVVTQHSPAEATSELGAIPTLVADSYEAAHAAWAAGCPHMTPDVALLTKLVAEYLARYRTGQPSAQAILAETVPLDWRARLLALRAEHYAAAPVYWLLIQMLRNNLPPVGTVNTKAELHAYVREHAPAWLAVLSPDDRQGNSLSTLRSMWHVSLADLLVELFVHK